MSLVKTDGGRFLRMSEDGLWYSVADDVARKKASQGKWQTTLYVMQILCEILSCTVLT